MSLEKIDLRPYISNPSLYISQRLLLSLKKEHRMYRDIAKKRPEFKKFVYEIENDIKQVKKELAKKKIRHRVDID